MKSIIGRAVLGLLGGIGLFIFLWSQGLVANPWQLGLLISILAALAMIAIIGQLVRFEDFSTHIGWFSAAPATPSPVFGATDPRLRRLRHTVHDAVDPPKGSTRPSSAELHDLLNTLAVEKLEARGVDLQRNPQAFHQYLGPEVAGYLTSRPEPRVSAKTLNAVINRIEEL
ncbi:hypothetical protein [Nesterenkonia sedimenti]|uniref:hypothetical protein n=1 Tax=Nesterenkonia sedimenti TaxID=1463632 RepID=UPI001E28E113|nr:hypothetical protein [Nesterenkonia sedimenti]